MRNLASAVIGAAALWLAAAAQPAHALAITFPQPSAVLMNFDLTGASPGPMFDSIELTIPRDITSAMGCSVFDDVMASTADQANVNFVNGCASSVTVTYTYLDPEMLDGLFSIGFGLSAGVTVTDPFAVGVRNGERTGPVYGTLVAGQEITGQVDEPATLALFGAALAAAGGLRRGRRRQA